MRKPFVPLISLILNVLAIEGLVCNGAELAQIENESLSVSISLQGAELQSISSKITKSEYLWQGDAEYWDRRALVMFPVNVAFRDWKFTHKGGEYEMPFLGLVESGSFRKVADSRPDSVVLEFQNTAETLERYPFPFRFRIRYSLEGSTLTQEFWIENRGTERMYFALGGHPGFRTPLEGGKGRGDYYIIFSKKMDTDRIVVADNLQQNTTLPYLKNEDRISLNDPRVPNSGMFLKSVESRQIGLGFKGKAPYLTLDLGDFPNVNMWTPEGMPFVCIEPMIGHHDQIDASYEISEKECVVSLAAGEVGRYRFSMTVNDDVPGP
jgi:galactose mutarotase-like enzyme